MAESTYQHLHPHRNLNEDPVILSARRYGLSNDPAGWPNFNSWEAREQHIIQYLQDAHQRMFLAYDLPEPQPGEPGGPRPRGLPRRQQPQVPGTRLEELLNRLTTPGRSISAEVIVPPREMVRGNEVTPPASTQSPLPPHSPSSVHKTPSTAGSASNFAISPSPPSLPPGSPPPQPPLFPHSPSTLPTTPSTAGRASHIPISPPLPRGSPPPQPPLPRSPGPLSAQEINHFVHDFPLEQTVDMIDGALNQALPPGALLRALLCRFPERDFQAITHRFSTAVVANTGELLNMMEAIIPLRLHQVEHPRQLPEALQNIPSGTLLIAIVRRFQPAERTALLTQVFQHLNVGAQLAVDEIVRRFQTRGRSHQLTDADIELILRAPVNEVAELIDLLLGEQLPEHIILTTIFDRIPDDGVQSLADELLSQPDANIESLLTLLEQRFPLRTDLDERRVLPWAIRRVPSVHILHAILLRMHPSAHRAILTAFQDGAGAVVEEILNRFQSRLQGTRASGRSSNPAASVRSSTHRQLFLSEATSYGAPSAPHPLLPSPYPVSLSGSWYSPQAQAAQLSEERRKQLEAQGTRDGPQSGGGSIDWDPDNSNPSRTEAGNPPDEEHVASQSTSKLESSRGTESTLEQRQLERARTVRDEGADTASSAKRPRLEPRSPLIPSYTLSGHRGRSPSASPHFAVCMVGEINRNFLPLRGDIIISHPSAAARGHPALQPSGGCIKVWDGFNSDRIKTHLRHGDLLLRIGMYKESGEVPLWSLHRPQETAPEAMPYRPYYRLDLYALSLGSSQLDYKFLGYQHPNTVDEKAASFTLECPGKNLARGAFCPPSFGPGLGDVIIKEEAWAENFAHKKNFRRSLVKWYKTRPYNSGQEGKMQQSTEIPVGAFLLRPFVGRMVPRPGDEMDYSKWGFAELYRLEKKGWTFWGRDKLIVDRAIGKEVPPGRRMESTALPLLYTADPGPRENNPNSPHFPYVVFNCQ